MFCPLSDVELCPASMQLLQRSGGIEGVDAGDSHGLEGYGEVSPCFGVEGWICLSFV